MRNYFVYFKVYTDSSQKVQTDSKQLSQTGLKATWLWYASQHGEPPGRQTMVFEAAVGSLRPKEQ